MKCGLLSEHNLALLFDFVDDQNTKYNEDTLKAFLSEKNAFGYIAEDNGKAVGFAYGKPGLPQNVFADKHRQRVCVQML